jgi:hypothetical protein
MEFEDEREFEWGFSINEVSLFEEGVLFEHDGVVWAGDQINVLFVVKRSIKYYWW